MSKVGGSYFRTRQMIRIFKIQLVPTVVKHMNHFVRQNTLDHTFRPSNILAHHNLKELGNLNH